MDAPLSIAFVWHMHQPFYRSSPSGPFEMPWVRLHALKDYADMVDILAEFPTIRQTFNLVPSLLDQLEAYASGAFVDRYWEQTLTPAEELDDAARAFIVELMVEPATHPRIARYPRYRELAEKKEACRDRGPAACAATFTSDELRDIQVWFTLAWFDPRYLEQEPLAGLVAKGRDFSEADKEIIAQEQRRLLAATLPTYAAAAARGQVELITSPYYHPILPLLVDTDLARVARGDIGLPARRFAHPEDAREQIARGLRRFEEVFGTAPRGLWCSEMAVGESVIPLLADRGIDWSISDESVLARSLGTDITRDDEGHVRQPTDLYSPYLLEREGRAISMIFRDRVLSDLIGFTYRSWDPRDAAANLVWRLHQIRRNLAGSPGPHLVTIALDGENAWEYYQRDGYDFLASLYTALSRDPDLTCVTVSEFLRDNPPQRGLPWLHTGSWIYADLSTWIGDPAHSRAWELLHDARDHVAGMRTSGVAPDTPATPGSANTAAADREPEPSAWEEAWQHILVAEGSDWFWWFGEHQESGIDHLWDLQFRRHLREAYCLVGMPLPPELLAPLFPTVSAAEAEPTATFTPVIDGRLTTPEEWSPAGVRRAPRGGVMLPGEGRHLEDVRYGRDEHHVFFLAVPGKRGLVGGIELLFALGTPVPADAGPPPDEAAGSTADPSRPRLALPPGFARVAEVEVRISAPGRVHASLSLTSAGRSVRSGTGRPDAPTTRTELPDIAFDEVVELAVPLELLGMGADARLCFVVAVAQDGVLQELLPGSGAVVFDLAAVDGGDPPPQT